MKRAESLGWWCYLGKRNHHIVSLVSGNYRALCNMIPAFSFPLFSWEKAKDGVDYCSACQKVLRRNNFARNHPGREAIPSWPNN